MGPRPVGDAGAMRAQAAGLRAEAGRCSDAADRLADVTSIEFRGPAAHRFRAEVRGEVARMMETAAEILQIATLLTSGADQLEGDQRAWDEARAREKAAETAREMRERLPW